MSVNSEAKMATKKQEIKSDVKISAKVKLANKTKLAAKPKITKQCEI